MPSDPIVWKDYEPSNILGCGQCGGGLGSPVRSGGGHKQLCERCYQVHMKFLQVALQQEAKS